MCLTSLARRYAADNVGAVGNGVFGIGRRGLASEAWLRISSGNMYV